MKLSRKVDRVVMCRKCRKDILPQLAQPGWYKLRGSDHAKTDEQLASSPAKKAIRRNQRKFGKAAPRDDYTPHFCPGGCGQPVNSAANYCGPCREEYRSRTKHVPRTHYQGLKAS